MPNLWYKQLHPSALSQELLWLIDGLVIHPVLGARNCAEETNGMNKTDGTPSLHVIFPDHPQPEARFHVSPLGSPDSLKTPSSVSSYRCNDCLPVCLPASPEAICWLNLGSVKVLSWGVVTGTRKWHGTDEVGHRHCGQGVQGNVDRGQGRKQRKQQKPLLLLLPQGVTESVVRETCLEPDTEGLAVWFHLFCYRIGTPKEVECESVVARGWGQGGWGG